MRSRRDRKSRVSFDEISIRLSTKPAPAWYERVDNVFHGTPSVKPALQTRSERAAAANKRLFCRITAAWVMTVGLAIAALATTLVRSSHRNLSDEDAIRFTVGIFAAAGVLMLVIAHASLACRTTVESLSDSSWRSHEEPRESRSGQFIYVPGILSLVCSVGLVGTRAPHPFAAARAVACTQPAVGMVPPGLASAHPLSALTSALAPPAAYERALHASATLGWSVVDFDDHAWRFNATTAVGMLPFDRMQLVSVHVRALPPPCASLPLAAAGPESSGRNASTPADEERAAARRKASTSDPASSPATAHPAAAAAASAAPAAPAAPAGVVAIDVCSTAPGRVNDFGLNEANIRAFRRAYLRLGQPGPRAGRGRDRPQTAATRESGT